MDIKLQKKGLDIEIKAKCKNHTLFKKILKQRGAKSLGRFKMRDIYFNVKNGRLKARIGDIKDILIQYQRENKKFPKRSDFLVSVIDRNSHIIPILINSLGIKVIVDKEREICILDNIRFHFDRIRGLGNFIEIEARGEEEKDIMRLKTQIKEYMGLFKINRKSLIANSSSDLVLAKKLRKVS